MSTADLIQSEYDQKHFSLSNCWTLDHWMSGGPVAGVHPWLVLQTSLVLGLFWLEAAASSSLSLSHTISEIWVGTSTYISWDHSWLLALSKWQAMIRECRHLTVYFSCYVAIHLAYVSIRSLKYCGNWTKM